MTALTSFANTVGGAVHSAGATFESYDPYTGKPWALIPRDGATEVDAAVAAAKAAFRSKEWAGITASARGKLLVRLADLVAENAGRLAVYRAAAEGLETVTLELSGKSANIVVADANIDNAVNGAISGIFAASSQTCIAGSRLLVHRGIPDDRPVTIGLCVDSKRYAASRNRGLRAGS